MPDSNTEFLGVSVPVGWKAKLTKEGNGNRSKAVCEAIAKAYGWDYDTGRPEAAKPVLVADVCSSFPVGYVRQLIANLDLGIVARTVERSKLNPISVLVVNEETGETSEPKKKRDGRLICVNARKIAKAIRDAGASND